MATAVQTIDKKVLIAKDRLLTLVKRKNPEANLAKIEAAFELAQRAHVNQKRASGDPYILHPVEVAEILADLRLDTATIITALLHDTVEDTEVTLEEIKRQFGPEIAKLVDGVTKLKKIEYQPEYVSQAENFRKLLLAISSDIRVLLVKLADRLHNMRTLHHIKDKNKRIKKAHETMEIYSLLAERIGIHKFKNELQDLAFAELHPKVRESIENRLEFLRNEGTSLIETAEKELNKLFADNKIKAEIQGREKTSCSIWHKMESKKVGFEQLSDIMAFRVIVDTIPECYQVLGCIHQKYHAVPGSIKDYISTPKNNGYRSLHTVVMGPESRCIEIQIRTREMHEVAELGVAAHWTYKQKVNYSNDGLQYRWIRELMQILESTESPEEFLENTRLEMYYDQVFCFTPEGELIALPKGATAIDFAFAIHSNIGLKCVGAKINGAIVPLKTSLENGDQVEIITSPGAAPSPDWEDFVITGKARAELRKFIRGTKLEEYAHLGRAILGKAFAKLGKEFTIEALEPAVKHFNKEHTDELLVAVAEGTLSKEEVTNFLHPKGSPLSFEGLKNKLKAMTKKEDPISIEGLIPGMAIHFASCCHPLPGEKIAGIHNTGKGITVHTLDCDTLQSFGVTPEKWVDISWEDTPSEEKYIGKLKIVITNRTGSLAEITKSIALSRANISNFKLVSRTPEFFEIVMDVEVKDIKHLTDIIKSLKLLDSVKTVERAKN
jgi:GTP pyrophosphokinase